jgi:hypothetical protein
MCKIWKAFKFLFIGPVVLVFLTILNLMTSPGHWWVQWPALGIGLAWVLCLLRVLPVMVAVGGITALIAYLRKR